MSEEMKSLNLTGDDIIDAISKKFKNFKKEAKDTATLEVKEKGVDELNKQVSDLAENLQTTKSMMDDFGKASEQFGKQTQKAAKEATKAVKELTNAQKHLVNKKLYKNLTDLDFSVKKKNKKNKFDDFSALLPEDLVGQKKQIERNRNAIQKSMEKYVSDVLDVKDSYKNFNPKGKHSSSLYTSLDGDLFNQEEVSKNVSNFKKESKISEKVFKQYEKIIIDREKLYSAMNNLKTKHDYKNADFSNTKQSQIMLNDLKQMVYIAKKIEVLDKQIEDGTGTKSKNAVKSYDFEVMATRFVDKMINPDTIEKLYTNQFDQIKVAHDALMLYIAEGLEKGFGNVDISGVTNAISSMGKSAKKEVDKIAEEFKRVNTYISEATELEGKAKTGWNNMNKTGTKGLSKETQYHFVGQIANIERNGGNLNKDKNAYKYYLQLLEENAELKQLADNIKNFKPADHSPSTSTQFVDVEETKKKAEAIKELNKELERSKELGIDTSKFENTDGSSVQSLEEQTEALRKLNEEKERAKNLGADKVGVVLSTKDDIGSNDVEKTKLQLEDVVELVKEYRTLLSKKNPEDFELSRMKDILDTLNNGKIMTGIADIIRLPNTDDTIDDLKHIEQISERIYKIYSSIGRDIPGTKSEKTEVPFGTTPAVPLQKQKQSVKDLGKEFITLTGLIHASKVEFDKFDDSKLGSDVSNNFGKGAYFTFDKSSHFVSSGDHGNIVSEWVAKNIKDIFDITGKNKSGLSEDEALQILKSYLPHFGERSKEYINDWIKNLTGCGISAVDAVKELANINGNVDLRDIFKSIGYDAIQDNDKINIFDVSNLEKVVNISKEEQLEIDKTKHKYAEQIQILKEKYKLMGNVSEEVADNTSVEEAGRLASELEAEIKPVQELYDEIKSLTNAEKLYKTELLEVEEILNRMYSDSNTYLMRSFEEVNQSPLPLDEESTGQLSFQIDGVKEASFAVENAQESIREEIKETNEVLEGQIDLFDYLKQVEKEKTSKPEKLLDLEYQIKNVGKSGYSKKDNYDWIEIYESKEEAIAKDLEDKKLRLHSSLNLILSEDKESLGLLTEEANKLKSSLQPVQDMVNRISSNSSIAYLNEESKGSEGWYKGYAEAYKTIDDRLGELNDKYKLTNEELEEYITLQVKAEKIMDAMADHSGGVQGSGAKNKHELRTWIEKSFARDLGIDPEEIYNGLFGNIGDALYEGNGISLFDENGTKRNLRGIAADILEYKGIGSYSSDEDAKRLRTISTILSYISKNASEIESTDFSAQIKSASKSVDFYERKLSEGEHTDFYSESLEKAKKELQELINLQDRLNKARGIQTSTDSSPALYKEQSGQLAFVEGLDKTNELLEEESGQMTLFEVQSEKATDAAIEGQMHLNDYINKNIEGQMTLNDLLEQQETTAADTFVENEKRKQEALDKTEKKLVYHAGYIDENNLNKSGYKSMPLGTTIPGISKATGLYTTGELEDFVGNEWSFAPISTIDLSHYNMFVAQTSEVASKINEFFNHLDETIFGYSKNYYKLSKIDEYNDSFGKENGEELRRTIKSLDILSVEDLYKEFCSLFGDVVLDFDQFKDFIEQSKKIVSGYDFSGIIDSSIEGRDSGIYKQGLENKVDIPKEIFNLDSFQTQLLKILGFEGIDFTKTSFGGTYSGGTVIFDIKPESIVKKNENFFDAIEGSEIEHLYDRNSEEQQEHERERVELAKKSAISYQEMSKDLAQSSAESTDIIVANEEKQQKVAEETALAVVEAEKKKQQAKEETVEVAIASVQRQQKAYDDVERVSGEVEDDNYYGIDKGRSGVPGAPNTPNVTDNLSEIDISNFKVLKQIGEFGIDDKVIVTYQNAYGQILTIVQALDELGNVVNVSNGVVTTSFKDLESQVKSTYGSIIKDEAELAKLKEKYGDKYDDTAIKSRIGKNKQILEALLVQSEIYANDKKYAVEYDQFLKEYSAIKDEILSSQSIKNASIEAKALVQQENQVKKLDELKSKYNKKLSSVNGGFKHLKEYSDVQNAIKALVDINDLTEVETAFNNLEKVINEFKQNVKSSASLDPIFSAMKTRENIDSIVEKYEKDLIAIGLSAKEAKEKVKELFDIAEKIKKINLKSDSGMSDLGKQLNLFNIQRNKLDIEKGTMRSDNSINKQVEKAYKKLSDTEDRYLTLTAKEKTGTITDKQTAELKELNTEREKAYQITQKVTASTQEEIDAQQRYNDILNASDDILEKYVAKEQQVVSLMDSSAQMMAGFAGNASKQSIDGFDDLLVYYQNKINDLNEKLLNTKNPTTATFDKYKKDIANIRKELDSILVGNVDIENAENAMRGYLETIGVSKNEIGKFDSTNKTITATFEDQNKKIHNVTLKYDELTKTIKILKSTTEDSKSFLTKFIDGLKGRVMALGQYLLSFASFYDVINKLRQGIQVVRDLDLALTEMRKVSDETVSSLRNFQDVSFDIANSIGTTAVQIQNSAADFMRLGFSLKEASELAKDANIYANVGDMEIDEATEHMISSIKAWESEFSSEVEASEAIIDRYNEIGNNFAISSADIGSAMERSAAALKAGGNTLNESLGLITAGNIIQQDAETTAAALKILSLRIRGSKAELEEMGESTDDLASSSSKLREEIKALTGVDIMADENTYKSTAKIIQEIGAVYEQLSDVSQAALLEKLAGEQNCLKNMETYFYRTHLNARIA